MIMIMHKIMHKTMIMQHLVDAGTCKKLDFNIDMKTDKKGCYTNTINDSQNHKTSE